MQYTSPHARCCHADRITRRARAGRRRTRGSRASSPTSSRSCRRSTERDLDQRHRLDRRRSAGAAWRAFARRARWSGHGAAPGCCSGLVAPAGSSDSSTGTTASSCSRSPSRSRASTRSSIRLSRRSRLRRCLHAAGRARAGAVHVQAARQPRPRHLLPRRHGGARHARTGVAESTCLRSISVIALLHTLLVAATFLVTLYALWTYQWGVSWTPDADAGGRYRASMPSPISSIRIRS